MRLKSVLNTDAFDVRRYREIYEMSNSIQQVAKKGKGLLPTFPDLLGDIWASLFKMRPEIKEKIPKGMEANKVLMEKNFSDPRFQDFREFTRLDDLSAALGTVSLGEAIYQWLEEAKSQNQKLQEAFQKAKDAQHQKSKKDDSEVGKKQRQEAQKNLTKALKEIAELLKQEGNGSSFQEAIMHAIQETHDTKKGLEMLVSGIKPGDGPAELKKIPLRDQMALAEKIKNTKKLKEIAKWAGRFKQIARKKQKSKKADSFTRNGVSIGNQVERLLPLELGLYTTAETEMDFLRRFCEGTTMMYDQRGEETLGRGPVILCLDQSSSMRGLDDQAKGFALALMSVAKKQRRDFALVLFSTNVKTLKYPKGKVSPNEMVDLATIFLGGGTRFDRPLEKAVEILNESHFKKADVVFVTDGEANLGNKFIDWFNKLKKEKDFNVLGIKINDSSNGMQVLSAFSDQIVNIRDFQEEEGHIAFEI